MVCDGLSETVLYPSEVAVIWDLYGLTRIASVLTLRSGPIQGRFARRIRYTIGIGRPETKIPISTFNYIISAVKE